MMDMAGGLRLCIFEPGAKGRRIPYIIPYIGG